MGELRFGAAFAMLELTRKKIEWQQTIVRARIWASA